MKGGEQSPCLALLADKYVEMVKEIAVDNKLGVPFEYGVNKLILKCQRKKRIRKEVEVQVQI